MAQYKIIKPVDFGKASIGDKNYGPSCPSCWVPINNYAPKVGQIVEGTLETRGYKDANGVDRIGTGISWVIATNGSASTQGQRSIQFITEDHLQAYTAPTVDPQPSVPSNPAQENSSSQEQVKDGSCWVCEHKIGLLLIAAAIVVLFILAQE